MMGPASSSCEAGNVYAQLTVVLFHGLALVNYSSKRKNRLFLLLTMLASVYCLVIRNIHRGIFAHLFMGMMAIEAAARIVRHPLIVLAGSEAILGVVFFLPNFYAVMEETLFSIRQDPVCCHLDIHGLSEFANAHFYDKQHAQLHGALSIMVLSVAMSVPMRWRHSPRVQMARIFIEPSCLVAVAMILFTHHHGTTLPWEGEGFATHPVMGFLMCTCAVMHMVTSAAHLGHPTPNGRTPDLCSPLPGGGPPALRMSRLVGAFAYLLLGFFLYIDTHMEYMGCRQEVILVGEANTGPRLGHSAGSEISTYLSCTFVLASCAMGLLIWSMPLGDDEGGGGGGGAKVSCAQQEATKLQLLKAADTEGEGCGLLQEGAEGAAASLQADLEKRETSPLSVLHLPNGKPGSEHPPSHGS